MQLNCPRTSAIAIKNPIKKTGQAFLTKKSFIIYFLFRNPTPENKIAINDANNTESKPLSIQSVIKYTAKDISAINQSNFKYFIRYFL